MHGRGRNPESMDDLFFGVHDEMLYARKTDPVEGSILIFSPLFLFHILYFMPLLSTHAIAINMSFEVLMHKF